MNDDRIWTELNAVFREVFDDETLTVGPETTAADIEDWDSQAHIALTVAVEERFGVRFRTAELEGLKNVDDFVRLIKARLVGV
jgi:acyl carrier protein